ncbi:Hypothetical predicted protein [Octopus vulgaris]|uniref:DUF7041 domain-containing protein n=1 Tax=Octopus vulgaris TaxID=6645 RepID=A0AA36ASB1_OCTVU|nr:Hypothetical predicted protein [Octopus vulgaris]
MFMGSLPTFTGDATLWFSQLEAQFRAQSITPEQQLQILYGCMPPQLASTARDLITDPSPGATYASVKLEVEKRNTRSEESRFNELMADEQLGDRTPSEFLRRLRELSGCLMDGSVEDIAECSGGEIGDFEYDAGIGLGVVVAEDGCGGGIGGCSNGCSGGCEDDSDIDSLSIEVVAESE